MAVYKRGYQRYQGPTTSHLGRMLVLPRYAWQRLFQQRLLLIALILACFWPLLCGLFIYISNNADILAMLPADEVRDLMAIDGKFFLIFMNAQAVAAVIIAALSGPGLIAPDLANNALPLYFSRPMSRTEYVVARMTVLLGMLAMVTWVPGLLLFGMQTGMAGWTWFSNNWNLGIGIFVGFALWTVLLSLVALASSAWVKWKIVAGALVLAFFFVLAGAAELVNEVLRIQDAGVANPARAAYVVWCGLLDVPNAIPRGPGPWPSAMGLLTMAGLLVLVLERKLRPVEVVS